MHRAQKMTRLDPPWFLGTNIELYRAKNKKESLDVQKQTTKELLRMLKDKREREMTEIAINGLLNLNK